MTMMRDVVRDAAIDGLYLADLDRIGLDVTRWDVLPAAVAQQAPMLPGPLRSTRISWTDAEIGLFLTELGTGSVAIESIAARDMLAFSIHPCSLVGRYLSVDGRVSRSHGIDLEIIFIPRHATLRVGSTGDCYRSLVLLATVDFLSRELGHHADFIPPALAALLAAGGPSVRARPLSPPVRLIAEELMLHTAGAPPLPRLYIQGRACDLLCAMINDISADGGAGTPSRPISHQDLLGIERVRSLIATDLARDHPVAELACLAAMNRTKLRALFKGVYGTTIAEFRMAVRMTRAASLLQGTDHRIAAIGYDLGYADAASFAIAFKKFHGRSPSRVRQAR
jgi:AraC-like DNA-binding protein